MNEAAKADRIIVVTEAAGYLATDITTGSGAHVRTTSGKTWLGTLRTLKVLDDLGISWTLKVRTLGRS